MENHDLVSETETYGYDRGASVDDSRAPSFDPVTIDYNHMLNTSGAEMAVRAHRGSRVSPGQIVTARVIEVCGKGVVVEVNGMRGYVYRSELGVAGNESRPEDFAVGEWIRALVTHVDHAANRVSLSIRATLENGETNNVIGGSANRALQSRNVEDCGATDNRSVDDVKEFERICEDKYRVGQTVSGVVIEIGRYGATVDLGDVYGLVPTRYLAWGMVENAQDVIAVGDRVRAKVMDFDWDRPRIVISIKHEDIHRWENFVALHPPGSIVTGRVFQLRNDGVMLDLGGMVEFLPNREMAWYPVLHPHDVVSVGDTVDVRVMAVAPEERRIRISLRQVDLSDWEDAVERNCPGAVVAGTVVEVSDDFAVLEVDKVRGDVHVGELSWAAVPSAHDVVRVGDQLSAKVLRVCEDEYKFELSVKQLNLAPWEEFIRQHAPGSVVRGTVQSIAAMHATVDVDGVRGMIPIGEVAWHPISDIREELAVGSTVEAQVVKFNHIKKSVDLSLRLMRLDVWEDYVAKYGVGEDVTAVVKYFTKFGAVLDIGGVKGLLSVNDMDWGPASDPSQFVKLEQELRVRILELDQVQHRIFVGLRQLHPEPWQRFVSNHPIGSEVSGTVAAIHNSRVILNVEGIKGIIPINQLSPRPWTDPTEVVAVGDTVRGTVAAYRKQHCRVILRAKQPDEQAWGAMIARYRPGLEVSGTVRSIGNREVLVDLGDAVGRIPIGELAWRRIRHPREVVSEGTQVETQVLRANAEQHCIDLSLRNRYLEDWVRFVEQNPVGSEVEATVEDLTRVGAFVDIAGMEALLANRDMSWERWSPERPVVRIGERIKVKVLGIDSASRKISVGRKQCLRDPWQQVMERYHPGQRVHGTIVNVMNYGAFVELEPGVSGLLHRSEIPQVPIGTELDEMLHVGQEVEVGVLDVVTQRRRIALTQKFATSKTSRVLRVKPLRNCEDGMTLVQVVG